jgi:hypothetical protein
MLQSLNNKICLTVTFVIISYDPAPVKKFSDQNSGYSKKQLTPSRLEIAIQMVTPGRIAGVTEICVILK